jgi:hypothetical protein
MAVLSAWFYYIRWHYTRAFQDILGIWSNYVWYIGNVFSFSVLLRTFLSPIKLIQESKGSFVSDPSQYAQNLLVNIIMRIVGMIARSVFIALTLMLWVFSVVLGLGFVLLWFFLPVLVVLSFIWGVVLFIS